MASVLLPARFRHPVAVIYRFARIADDFADEGDVAAKIRLDNLQDFRDRLDAVAGGKPPSDPLFAEISAIVARHALPLQPFRDLHDALSQDVVKTR